MDFRTLGAHALTLSSHKINGPQGAGGAGRRQARRTAAADRRRRAGTGAALGHRERRGDRRLRPCLRTGGGGDRPTRRRLEALRDTSRTWPRDAGRSESSAPAPSGCPIPATSASRRLDGETLVAQLDRGGFAVASGAACSSASPEPSRTLLAMGVGAGDRSRCGAGEPGPRQHRATRCSASRRFWRSGLVQLKRMSAVAV
ncbi:MAG: hypothetical protein MZW92_29350 [Comamonadaceae bacterium]|nr:hypothetical protein [Comamonadaceae bacterium]